MECVNRALILAVILSLSACSQTAKKETNLAENDPQQMYELPSTVDYEKAARLNIELAMGYLRQDQVSRAKAKFNRAKNLAPDLPEVYYSLGYFYERVGETAEAEKAYQKAVRLNPKGGVEHNSYGTFLCRNQQYDKADKEFQRAIEDPNYTNTAETLENAGICALQIPDVAKATEYLEKSLRYDSNRLNALLELAIIKYQQGKIAHAREYHARFVRLSKPTARSLLLGLELAKNTGDRAQEAKYASILRAQFPSAKRTDLFHTAQR